MSGSMVFFFSPNHLQSGLRSGINCPNEAQPLDYNRSMKNAEPFIEGHLGLELCIPAPSVGFATFDGTASLDWRNSVCETLHNSRRLCKRHSRARLRRVVTPMGRGLAPPKGDLSLPVRGLKGQVLCRDMACPCPKTHFLP